MLQVLELRFPAACGAGRGEADVSLQPMEDCGAAVTWGRSPTLWWGCPKEAVTLRKAHSAPGSWQELWAPGEEPMLEQDCWENLRLNGDPSWSSTHSSL